MKKQPKAKWSEVRESVKNLNATIDKVQQQLSGKPETNIFEEMFKGFTDKNQTNFPSHCEPGLTKERKHK